MDIQLKKGLLEVCVLASLLQEDSYGYQLISDLSSCVEISESTLYPILKRLDAAKCLTTYSREHNGRLRKYYSITPEGIVRIQEFLRDWPEILEVYNYIEKISTKEGCLMMTRIKVFKGAKSFSGKAPQGGPKRILEFYNELIDDKLEAKPV